MLFWGFSLYRGHIPSHLTAESFSSLSWQQSNQDNGPSPLLLPVLFQLPKAPEK